MKKIILFLIMVIGLNAQGVFDLLGTAQRIKALNVNPSYVSFDGVDDYYSVADNDNLDFGTGDFSVVIRIKTAQTSNATIMRGNTSGNSRIVVEMISNKIVFRTLAVSSDFYLTSNTSINDGEWHTITLTRSATTSEAFVYVDGQPDNSTSGITVGDVIHTGILYIGQSGSGGTYFDGEIGQVKLYNRALSASEISNTTDGGLYNYGHPELATSDTSITNYLVGWWDADNATSYSWIDKSGLNNHKQASGSPLVTRNKNINTIKQFKGSIAANTNTTLTSIIPKGYRIVAIRAQSGSALAAIKIGSSSGGEQVVASTTTTAGQSKILTLASTANDAYSESADVTLYARHDTGASGKTMNLIFICEKVNL